MVRVPPLVEGAFQGVRSKNYPKGQIILYQGDPPLEVFLLTDGIIKVYDIDDQHNEKVLTLLKPWSIIPFAFFSGSHEATQWYYAALTDCEVYVIDTKVLQDQMNIDTELAQLLMYWFYSQMNQILQRLSSLGKTNTRDKLNAALKYLAAYHAELKRSGWSRVNFPVNHQLLADMTGMTRESAAMIMKNLKDEHLIRQPRQAILRNRYPKNQLAGKIPTVKHISRR
jgi:CRP-like cAMP-binding protein